jgi:hypothetical protein
MLSEAEHLWLLLEHATVDDPGFFAALKMT